MVKCVINGYFRSGTSAIWSMIYNSGGNCIYEPCHNHLKDYLSTTSIINSENKLHGMNIWECYKAYVPEILSEIEKKLVTYDVNVPRIFHYFNNIDDDFILQVNRWHFIIDEIKEVNQDVNIVHIIRNPFDIYQSIIKAYLNEGAALERYIKKMLPMSFYGRAFEISKINKELGGEKDSPEYMHLRNWIVTNYCAIKSISDKSGLLIVYERATRSSLKYHLNKVSGIDVDCSSFRERNSIFINDEQLKTLTRVAMKYNLEKELSIVMNSIRSEVDGIVEY